MFTNAQNNLFQNSSFTIYTTNFNAGPGQALSILYNNVAPNAILNAGGRADEVRCHPGTREKVIGVIDKWRLDIQNKVAANQMLWLSGPAGAGKTAIVQTIAEEWKSLGIHTGNFFFFRTDPSRSHARSFVSTLLYQIFEFVPAAREVVDRVLGLKPRILDAGLEEQVDELICATFRSIHLPVTQSIILLVDGLDECDPETKTSQRQILHILAKLVGQEDLPFLVLISSRAEPHISAAFRQLTIQVLPVFLDDQYSPEKDILLFVTAEFEKIKKWHPQAASLENNWPPDSDVHNIVKKSSGKFVYAATVMRFLAQSATVPSISLENVQDTILSDKNFPFSQLDALNSYILQQEQAEVVEEKIPPVIMTPTPKPPVQAPTLIVSDNILGFGSHGTVVLRGSLQGRAVAVKRLLNDFVTLATREVSILQESDDHPNVIRYYYQESQGSFLYIALELCPASLADIIENPDRDAWRDIATNFDPKKALKQMTSGLRHLHALGLVHRDIKPQNILISASSSRGGFDARTPGAKVYRMLISDFGMCKKLEMDETSFLSTAHGAMGAGTVGWRAPEVLRGDVKLDDVPNGDESMSSRGSETTIGGSSSSTAPSGKRTRLTKSVDIFALGCLFYYTLTSGEHPYGNRFEREANIMRDAKDLAALERFGEEGTEAANLITAMLCPEAKGRPDTTTILLHPFFWDAGRRLNFLQDASDRFEIMCREPRDPNLVILETNAHSVVGHDWHSRLDKIFIDNLGKYRKYDGKSIQDLMRAMRNKKHHYQDLPDNVKQHLGPLPEGFLGYFTGRYPPLFLHVHGVVKETGLHSESMFRAYFELPDSQSPRFSPCAGSPLSGLPKDSNLNLVYLFTPPSPSLCM